jgi:hypothetical protein
MAALFGRKVSLVISAPGKVLGASAAQGLSQEETTAIIQGQQGPPIVKATFNDSAGFDVSGLDIDFSIKRSLVMKHPNTCDIRVFNLSEQTRKQISGEQNLTVSLAAGYQGQIEQIYFAEARAAWTERHKTDWVTHIEAGDGDKALKARCNTGLGGRIPVGTALQAIVTALGIGPGNVAKIQNSLASGGFSVVSASSLRGSAARVLTDFCRSAGLEWSIQNGNLVISDVGALTSNQIVLCSVDTGMVDSPTVDSQGLLSAKMIIQPGVIPGALVQVKSLFYNGAYRITRCHWQGSVRGQDWYVSFEAQRQ